MKITITKIADKIIPFYMITTCYIQWSNITINEKQCIAIEKAFKQIKGSINSMFHKK